VGLKTVDQGGSVLVSQGDQKILSLDTSFKFNRFLVFVASEIGPLKGPFGPVCANDV
jgi:hypothetical protein